MSLDHYHQFFPAVCAGLGLFLVGVVNLVLHRCTVGLRIVATLAAVGLTLGAAGAIDQPGVSVVADTARLLAFGLFPFVALGSRHLIRGLVAVTAAVGRPTVRFGLLTVAGVGVILGSVVRFEAADDACNAAALDELEHLQARVPTQPASQGKASTDRGTRIALEEPISPRDPDELNGTESLVLQRTNLVEYVIRRGPANDHSNCHGWIFTGGRFQVRGADVETILQENAYRQVDDPQPGDLVVYRNAGTVTHTAIVRYVTQGLPLLVESKWGNLGVYLHPVDRSVYGTDYTIYRSSRPGHLLAGFDRPVGADTTSVSAGTH